MVILICMNNGENFTFGITEENYKSFKMDSLIYQWLKLNDYGFKTDTEIYIRKEKISYYGLV